MYKFEKKYVSIAINAVSSMKLNLKELSEERIEGYAALIYKLLIELNEKYDLIVSGGNSGLFVTQIVRQIYNELKLEPPQIIVLPIVRYKGDVKVGYKGGGDRFDNSYILPFLETELKDKKPQKILFVDDEIRLGWTAKTIFELLEKVVKKNLFCTMVAENHFFEWQYKLPNISIRYFPHAALVPGINNIFSYLVPADLGSFVSSKFSYLDNRNKIFAALLTGEYKLTGEDRAIFADFNEDFVFKSKNSLEWRMALLKEIQRLVSHGIKAYKRGLITFKS